MAEQGRRTRRWWADRWLWRWHLLIGLSVGAALLAVRLHWLGGSWFFWTLLVWAAVLFAHYLVVKTMNVDERWADARSADLRMRSYDLKHVIQIVDSAVDGDPATDPAAPRNGRPPPRTGESGNR